MFACTKALPRPFFLKMIYTQHLRVDVCVNLSDKVIFIGISVEIKPNFNYIIAFLNVFLDYVSAISSGKTLFCSNFTIPHCLDRRGSDTHQFISTFEVKKIEGPP